MRQPDESAQDGDPRPKRRRLSRFVAFAICVVMVSMDLPSLRIPTFSDLVHLAGVGKLPATNRQAGPAEAAALPQEVPIWQTPPRETGLEAPSSEPTTQADTSRQLMAAIEALLESKNPEDPVTRKFVEDAIRVVNQAEVTPGKLTEPTAPGAVSSMSEPPSVTSPESAK